MKRLLFAAVALLAAPATASAQMDHGNHHAGPTVSVGFAAFAPAELDVLAGDAVTWSNGSARKHDVAALDLSFNSGTLLMGSSFQRAFDHEGAVPYFCTIHPNMQGTLHVHDLLLDAPKEPGAPGRPFAVHGRTALPAGTPVAIEADTGAGFTKVAEAASAADGTFTATMKPTAAGKLRATADGVEGSPEVSFLVVDRKITATFRRARIRAHVTPASPGSTVVLQTFRRERFGWWPSATRRLGHRSTATFKLRPKRATRARVVLTLADGATPIAISPTLRLRPARGR